MASEPPDDVPPHDHPVDAARVALARKAALGVEDAHRIADLVGLIGDPVRARLLTALHGAEELCVGDLALALDVSEDAVGYALRVLRTAGLVQRRREGRMAFYRLGDEGQLARLLDDLRRAAAAVT